METPRTGEWYWRQHYDLPEQGLVVIGRTEYTPESMRTYIEPLMEPGISRMLGDPNILGLKVWTDGDVVWQITAWEDFRSLERFVRAQIEWLSEIVDEVQAEILQRHNAYRKMATKDMPPSKELCEEIIQEVMRVSPLGADAFPALSRLLGLKEVGT